MKNFGYWLFGADMNKVNLETLKKNGVTDIFLNFYAFTAHGESKVTSWINKAKKNNINVHIWVQCFYDGSWHNPKTTDLTKKLKEIKKYAGIANVKGIHLDYLRYPGNAYKTSGGADAITAFVKKVRKENPKVFLSCAVMPEQNCKHDYGQDIEALGKIVDAIVPMEYKGNYKAGTDWLKSTTKFFSSKAKIWSGLQSYKSDDNPVALSSKEILNDAKTCLTNGAKGVMLFRYGLSPNVNFTSLQDKTTTKTKSTGISAANIKTMATTVKKYIETNKKLPSTVTVANVKYAWPQVWYILSWHVNNLGKNLSNVPSVKSCSKATGDSINEEIYPSDFKDQSKRVVQYIKQNGQAPNFVTSVKSKKKIRPRVSIDALARIIVWYYGHNKTLPDYCTYNSGRFTASSSSSKNNTKPATKSKYGHATKSGCNNMGQNNGVYCGPHSMQECIRNLTGKVIPQATLAGWAGTGSGGTDHQGLETAIAKASKELGVKLTVKWYSFSELGWSGIKKIIASKNQDCIIHNLYRRSDGHYEVVNAVNDSNVNVQNSLGNRSCNDCYCGYIEYRTKAEFESYIRGISQKSVMVITRG